LTEQTVKTDGDRPPRWHPHPGRARAHRTKAGLLWYRHKARAVIFAAMAAAEALTWLTWATIRFAWKTAATTIRSRHTTTTTDLTPAESPDSPEEK